MRLLIVAALLLAGCSATVGSAVPLDDSTISLIVPGTTAQEVRRILGSPQQETTTDGAASWVYAHATANGFGKSYMKSLDVSLRDGVVVKTSVTEQTTDF